MPCGRRTSSGSWQSTPRRSTTPGRSNWAKEQMRVLERLLLLRSIDLHWVNHLTAMENLRTGIGLQAGRPAGPPGDVPLRGSQDLPRAAGADAGRRGAQPVPRYGDAAAAHAGQRRSTEQPKASPMQSVAGKARNAAPTGQKVGTQRSMPLRKRPQVQAVLRQGVAGKGIPLLTSPFTSIRQGKAGFPWAQHSGSPFTYSCSW